MSLTVATKTKTTTRQRRGKKSSSTNYFDEKRFSIEILPHLSDPSYVPPESFVRDIFAITDGMINAEFGNNTYVLENRDDLKQECFCEVLKSLRKFNVDKGRSFAYFNRIIKNTLLKNYYKSTKIATKEVKIFDLASNYENLEDYTVDDLLSGVTDIKERRDDAKALQNSSEFVSFFDSDRSKENQKKKKTQEKADIEIAILKYLFSVKNVLHHIMSDKSKMERIISEIQFNDSTSFLDNFEVTDLAPLLQEAYDLFTECIDKINANIEADPLPYSFPQAHSVLITNRVLIYIKNEISSRKMRKKYNLLIRNPRASAEIIKIVLAEATQE